MLKQVVTLALVRSLAKLAQVGSPLDFQPERVSAPSCFRARCAALKQVVAQVHIFGETCAHLCTYTRSKSTFPVKHARVCGLTHAISPQTLALYASASKPLELELEQFAASKHFRRSIAMLAVG